MRVRIKFSLGVKALFLAIIILLTVTNYGQPQENASSAKESAVPLENMEKMVQTLESPEKREALIRDLKSLIELQKQASPAEQVAKGPPPKEPSMFNRLIIVSSQLTRQTADYLPQLLKSIRQIPNSLRSGITHISAQENRAGLYKFATIIAASIVLALIIILVIRRFTTMLLKAVLKKRKQTTAGRIYEGVVRMVIRISPYLGLLIAVFLVLSFLGVGGLPYRITMLFLLTLLQYEAIATASRIGLNPAEPKSRLLPLSDEAAAYASVWVKRFLLIWVAYYFVIRAMAILQVPSQLFALVSGILILLFPVLSTVLLLQISRRQQRETFPSAPPIWRKFLPFCARFWPVGAGGLIWLFSIFMVIQYRAGVTFLLSASLKTLAAAGVFWGLLYLIDPLFKGLFDLGKEMRARLPELEGKVIRYIGLLKIISKGIILVVGIGTILEFWGIGVSWLVTSATGSTILFRLIKIAITVGVVLSIMNLAKFITKQLVQPRTDADGNIIEPGKRQKTLIPLIYWVIMVASVFIGSVIVLNQLSVNVTPILAGAGIVGLAVGFGAQSLVKDFINGLFMLFEGSVSVGDVVIINGTGGLVEEVTLRTIKMRDLAGNVHVIPNGGVGMITNMTKEYSRYLFNVGVAYREDMDEVMATLKEIGESMQNDPEFKDDILEPLEILGVDKFGDSAVTIKARFKTKPIKQWRVGREFNRRMKKIFDERGIEIPFPHQTIYWGEPKTGPSSPLAVQVTGKRSNEGENPKDK